MSRISGLLLVALVASALMLVKSAYDTRRIFAEIHRAEAEGLRLAGEQRRLEAERQTAGHQPAGGKHRPHQAADAHDDARCDAVRKRHQRGAHAGVGAGAMKGVSP